MKRILSAALGAITFMSCFSFAAAATNETSSSDVKLPFDLEAPKNVFIKYLDGNDSFNSCNVSYSQNNSMSEFFSNLADPDQHDKVVEELNKQGIDDLWVQPQMDWSIDSSDDWHYNKYWDTDGYDENQIQRLGDWAYTALSYYPDQTNESWVFRDFGNIEDPEDRVWHGSHNGSDDYDGWKDVLKEGQYAVIKTDEGESHAKIDFTKHTIHVRMRYLVIVRKSDEENGLVDVPVASDWSGEALVGKDAEASGVLKKGDIDPPVITDLRMTDEEFNGQPVIAFKLEVPDKLIAQNTEITNREGRIILETECRVKGNDEWKEMQGDWILKSGEMKVTLLNLAEENKVISKDTPVELRCRYYCEQSEEEPFYSDYSEVLTFGTKEIDGRKESVAEKSNDASDEKTNEESAVKEESKSEKKCSVCGICPVQPLGICLFIWIAIIVAVIIVVIVIILAVNKKKSNK